MRNINESVYCKKLEALWGYRMSGKTKSSNYNFHQNQWQARRFATLWVLQLAADHKINMNNIDTSAERKLVSEKEWEDKTETGERNERMNRITKKGRRKVFRDMKMIMSVKWNSCIEGILFI